MNRRSIRFRLTAWYTAILAATFAVMGAGVWLAIRDSIDDTVDNDLRSRLQAMREFLQREPYAADRLRDELIENAALAPAGMSFRLSDGRGGWVYQSPGTEAWGPIPDAARLPKGGRFGAVALNGTPARMVSAPAGPGVLQIGVPTDEFSEMLDTFTWTALLASPLLLVVASAGGYWMSRRALAPVERIARTAREIEAHSLSERMPVRGTGDELDLLSETLNATFARLEESFRRMAQFTADASHELRTPIAIIRTTAEVIRRKSRSEKEYQEAVDRILAESVRTTGLIEDLMLLARADAKAEEPPFEPVAFDQLARAVCEEIGVLAQTAGVTLGTGKLAPCTVSGDAGALRRLLLILLENGIKYSKSGGEINVELDVRATSAIIKVRDTGIGIAPEDLPHIFERFYRASKDRSRKIDGVGLGLSIAQSIVRLHGGEIGIESELGAGTTVRVMLALG